MAAFARLLTETPALPALRRTISLGELLTVVRALAPAALRATFVALGTRALRQRQAVVLVEVLAVRRRQDLVPVDCLDVTEVVVVEHTYAAVQYI